MGRGSGDASCHVVQRHARAALWKSPRSELLRPSANSHVSEEIGSFSPVKPLGLQSWPMSSLHPQERPWAGTIQLSPSHTPTWETVWDVCCFRLRSWRMVCYATVAERTDRGKKEQQVEVTCSRSHNQSMAGAGSLHRSCGSEGHALCPTVRCLLKMLSLANAKSSHCKYKIFANWFMLQF